MNILITGGTGLIGRALINKLEDHDVTVLTRSAKKAASLLPSRVQSIESLDALDSFDYIDAIINLAGEPIVDKRWSEKQKGLICSSRWGLTEQIVKKILESDSPPHTFISGSAVGYYSNQGDKEIDESLKVDSNDFAHLVCANWEKIARRATATRSTRVCILRTGVVLSTTGGALKKMLLPYKLGLGGPIGKGKQFFPWIHLEDMTNGIIHLLNNESLKGDFNFTAPTPVTNKEFSLALATSLQRPHFLFTPEIAIKLALGEASQLLLDSQRVIPVALQESGFNFSYETLQPALENLVQ
ncbi:MULTISPECIES: TIGR01777 family oxidoreductase [Grimontia]|uniref:Epimerase family protein n=1 Tax=Grimontia marina TaxID=646534 RepID=A0A128FE85_9GAMM|nr:MULTISPECIES: TIGR01777 family oxidoreductase [Grimontia]WRV99123.1 TIGR01777 family oxidoreductase [Grimontia sp. NTOU-MAR1]CZF84634.1 Epimerase family protein [Grimontia marina]